MAEFDRIHICAAYAALETDWNVGGWLRERPSNQRRNESIGVQLHRMRYHDPDGGGFEWLRSDNEREIYCDALVRFGLAVDVHPADEHAGEPGRVTLAAFVRGFTPEYIAEHFPRFAPPRETLWNFWPGLAMHDGTAPWEFRFAWQHAATKEALRFALDVDILLLTLYGA